MNGKVAQFLAQWNSSQCGLPLRIGNRDRDIAQGSMSEVAAGKRQNVGGFIDAAEAPVELANRPVIGEKY